MRLSIMPSRLFIYYNERVIEHTVQQDAGAQIRDGIKSVNKLGACFEGTGNGFWPYVPSKLTTSSRHRIATRPRLETRSPATAALTPSLDQLKM